jgi:hypothetical protein
VPGRARPPRPVRTDERDVLPGQSEEEAVVERFHEEIQKAAKALLQPGHDMEFPYVDDGSRDRTLAVPEAAGGAGRAQLTPRMVDLREEGCDQITARRTRTGDGLPRTATAPLQPAGQPSGRRGTRRRRGGLLCACWSVRGSTRRGSRASRSSNGVETPDYVTIVMTITALTGVQMIMLGVIGEYTGRIHLEEKGRSRFLV